MTVVTASNEAGRLLKHLAAPGCYGLVSPLGCGRVALFRTVNGTSLGAGYVSAETVQALEAEGRVCWSRDAKAARAFRAGRPGCGAGPIREGRPGHACPG